MFPETRQDSTSSVVMQVQIVLCVDTEIVHVDLKPFLRDHVSKDMIHEGLECWRSIAETEKHDGGFIETKGSNECGLPLIFFVNVNIVISPSDVEFGEESGVFHVID